MPSWRRADISKHYKCKRLMLGNTRSTPQEIDSIQHTLEDPSEKHLVMQKDSNLVVCLD